MRGFFDTKTPGAPNRPVYLDYNATTPMDPEVVSAMMPWLSKSFGNPSSDHLLGREARQQVETAREEVAALIGAEPDEIVFTGSATEANNLAILGIAKAMESEKKEGLLVTSAIEHPSVLGPFGCLGENGWRTKFLPVDPTGRVDLGSAERIIGPETVFVSLMLANNETGAIQPVRAIADLAHARGAWVHVDASQATGKVPVDRKALGADLLTLAGHKFYAPKGIGSYRGARWHCPEEISSFFADLPVRKFRIHSAVFLPSGTTWARVLETVTPNNCLLGSLLIVSGERL